MSAIAGIWHWDGKPSAGEDCARMLAAQQVYGPHDGRHWSDGAIAMGRRLHRVLPEDIHDRQPLRSADGRLAFVADVRLDNREEIASDLGWTLDRASGVADAALLFAALERFGDGALDRLAGDFSFALWNAHTETLLLARDFLGQRPLHFYRGRSFFAFASMAKGLHALPEIPYAADEQSIAELVALMPQSKGGSYFKDIERVEAGEIVAVTRSGLTRRSYWNPRPTARIPGKDYVEGLRFHLDRATAVRLRGGEIASHLSAGLDSAAVTATAARLLAENGRKLTAYTSVPREGYGGKVPRGRIADEGPLAAATASLYPNIEHVLIRTGHLSPFDEIDRSFFLCESPTINLCNWVWTRAINEDAQRRGCNVLLTGRTGNMSISYTGLELLPELLSKGRLLRLAREAAQLIATGEKRWMGIAGKTLGPFMPAFLWQWAQRAAGRKANDILQYTAVREEALDRMDLRARAAGRDHDFTYRPRADGFALRMWVMRRIDRGNYNKGTLAGWGLDMRDPAADKRLVEFCLAVPMEEYLSEGIPRALAKRALADRVPAKVLRERRKGLQAVDWHEGLTAAKPEARALIERIATSHPVARLLDIERLQRLVEDWPTGGWERDDVVQAYRLALLRGVSAGHFLKKASGAN